ncbi:unnamed protein product [Clonostachys solani]|uniref:Isochorismatase-like domain-containing protein n=1 Tax=Clonostachys solani TaxID=160281 RepID=A0A9N9Z8J0_9HYPO|nr:unnamed protein product [Clonostachys solani]
MDAMLFCLAFLLTTAKGFLVPPPSDQKPLHPIADAGTIPIGPSGNQWFYSPETKSYDLTRGDTKNKPFSFSTTEGASNVTVVIAPELTTLIVIDMQNYFLDRTCNDHPSGIVAAHKTVELVKKCRDLDIKVIWLNWGLTDADLDKIPAAQMHSFRQGFANPLSPPHDERCGFGCDLGNKRGRVLMRNEWNSQLYEPLLKVAKPEDDLFINKNRVSGLWSDDKAFSQILEKDKRQTLLFAGVNTNQCVLGTLLDAYYRGYDCILVEDCCATNTPGGQDVSILDIWRNYGFVTTSSALQAGRLG